MLKLFVSGLLLILSMSSVAEAPNGDHYYITGKIAEYTQAFDRCNRIAEARDLPGEQVISKLAEFSQRDVERFLMSKAALLRQECEKHELTELAYAILITETGDLEQKTREAISVIKVLAFPVGIRKFQVIYQSVPTEIRQALEGTGYFNRPFDDRKVLDAIRNRP